MSLSSRDYLEISMGNNSFFYIGYAIKCKRREIERRIMVKECCGNGYNHESFCSECGEKIIAQEKIEKFYPLLDEIIPDDNYMDFIEKFDVLYPEGYVKGINENECYIILCGDRMDKEDCWSVEKIELNKEKIVKALKDVMYLSKYLFFHPPELIKAHYGEW